LTENKSIRSPAASGAREAGERPRILFVDDEGDPEQWIMAVAHLLSRNRPKL